MAKKKKVDQERLAAKETAKQALKAVVIVSIIEAAISLVGDALVGALSNSGMTVAVSMFVLAAMIVALIVSLVFMVKAFKAVMPCCEVAPSIGKKILLGAALWFGSVLPSGVVSVIRGLVTGTDDVVSSLISVGIGVVLVALAYRAYHQDLA